MKLLMLSYFAEGIFLIRAITPTKIDSAMRITAMGISTMNNPTTIIIEIPRRVRQDSLKFSVIISPTYKI